MTLVAETIVNDSACLVAPVLLLHERDNDMRGCPVKVVNAAPLAHPPIVWKAPDLIGLKAIDGAA